MIAAEITRLLTENGPLTGEDLLVALEGARVLLGIDPEGMLGEVLEADERVQSLADGRLAWVPSLLEGRVFTHRLTAGELEYDLLVVDPDLSPLSMLTEVPRYHQLLDGSPVIEVLPDLDAELLSERGIPPDVLADDMAFLLAPGTLRGLGAGTDDLVGLRVTADGFALERCPEVTAPPSDLCLRLDRILDDRAYEGPEELDTVVWTVCADDPDLFRTPLAPLGGLLDDAGLPHEGGQVGAAGFDFAIWRVGFRIGRLTEIYGLDPDEAVAVLATAGLFEQVAELYDAAQVARESSGDVDLGPVSAALAALTRPAAAEALPRPPGGGRGLVGDALPLLAVPAVAEAVLAETIGTGRERAGALGLFAETLEPMVPRAARPAVRWLRAKAQERLGDVARAEVTLGEAESLDPGWPPALYDLARYASDRGEAERGLGLLRRAGAPDDDGLVELLSAHQAPSRTDLGRNDRCWCGSGRKYKQCHRSRERLPLADRATWLHQKAGLWLQDGPWRETIIEVASVRAQHWDSPEALLAGVEDGLVSDALLFEGGGFAEFLAERGFLLPEDERLLAEQWLLRERSVFEVGDVRPGQGLTLRDVRTGDTYDVLERTASRSLTAGMLICTRVLGVDGVELMFGGVEPVALHERDDLIALLDSGPDPVELVAFLSRRFAPPQLSNTEGDPLVACEVSLHGPDPAGLIAALDDTYDRDEDGDEDGGSLWFEHVTTHGTERIRAVLRLRGDELRVETNSEARCDRILATLHDLQPGLIVTGERRTPADEMLASAPPGGTPAGRALDLGDPEVSAALTEVIRQYEQDWLDESIPALAGRTPRQAAADPTRRPDLIRLLDSFPDHPDDPGAMSPRRLRAALDLA